ncbi:MAG: histidine kinase [Propionibacteriaceae bacterium]|nr:histidine kinase [Propionibacteriaceae bacterium]
MTALGLVIGITLAVLTMAEWFPTGGWAPMLIGLALLCAAGLSTRMPGQGAAATGVLLAAFLLLPEGSHGVAVNAALVPVGALSARGRPWWATAVATVYTILLVAEVARGSASLWEATPYAGLWVLLFIVAVMSGQLVLRTAQAAEAQRLVEVADQRRLIARELHDTVAQDLTMLVMRGEHARAQGSTSLDLNLVLDVCRGTLQDLRVMLDTLHSDGTTRFRTAQPSTIAGLLEKARTRLADAGFRLDLVADADEADEAPVARTALAGVLREAVSNVIRHGDPRSPVKLLVGCADGRLEATLINAVAPRPVDAGHLPLGVAGMRERALYAGGVLEVTSSGTEWILRLDLPLDVTAQTQEDR